MDREKAAESESEGEGRYNYAPYFGFVVSFFLPLILLYAFTLCTFNKSENVSVWFKSNKAVDDLCQEVAGEKRRRQDLRDSFKVAKLQLTWVTCIGFHLNDCWINKLFLKVSWNVFLRYIKCNQRKLNSCTWLWIIWGLFKLKSYLVRAGRLKLGFQSVLQLPQLFWNFILFCSTFTQDSLGYLLTLRDWL